MNWFILSVALSVGAGPVVLGATLSITKDVRFTASAPQMFSQGIWSGRSWADVAPDIQVLRTRDGGTILAGFGTQ